LVDIDNTTTNGGIEKDKKPEGANEPKDGSLSFTACKEYCGRGENGDHRCDSR